jgi:site-specific recombinase XerD
MKPSGNVATLIERYFTERLMRQRNVSANTIASYRDTFRLLFTFAQARLRKPPSALALDDLDASLISAFLADLEARRGASVRTRNLRLTAIRSFFASPPRSRATAPLSNASSRCRASATTSGRSIS